VDSTQDKEWKSYEKIIFRTAFFFFLILSLPLENFVDWIQRIAAIDFLNVNYRDLYDIAGYRPSFIKINTESGRWGIASYATWPIALWLSIVGAALWTIVVKIRKSERKEYNTAYYWLRVVVRYRIAVGIIAFGYVKLFPTQMPYPSEAVLDTILG